MDGRTTNKRKREAFVYMKKAFLKPVIISIVFGTIFGAIALVSAVDHLIRSAAAIDDVLDYSDVFLSGFLHFDFDRFDYLWRQDSSILLSPTIFYFVGSMIGAQSFLKKNKSYYSFIYHRYQSSARLGTALVSKVWIPIILYTVFYFCSFIIGMRFISTDTIEPIFTITIIELSAFFTLRILVLLFLVHFLFIIFTKKEAAIALILNAVLVMLILLITIHAQFVNLAVFDDFNNLLRSIFLWIVVNASMWFIIKFGTKYKLSE